MINIISREKTYIPKFGGNRDLPSSEQIQVTYKAATIELKNKIVAKPVAIGDFDEAGRSRGMKVELKVDDDAYIRNMLIKISGAGFQEEGGKDVTYIRDSADLLKAPICYEPLLNELVDLFKEELNTVAIDEKN
ncbi:MAG: hypothetical protein LBH16_09285 [Treponema sp.]|jgi:hypothetical protein|nr:hypothetical protein [Treponema sp.]